MLQAALKTDSPPKYMPKEILYLSTYSPPFGINQKEYGTSKRQIAWLIID